jgi:predicted O-methyltransferase YrrM
MDGWGDTLGRVTDAEFIDHCFHRFLRRPADGGALAYYADRLAAGASREDVIQGIVVSDEFLALLHRQAFGRHVGSPFLSFAAPGHFYSPIPSCSDVAQLAARRREGAPRELPGIALNLDEQRRTLEAIGPFTRDLRFLDDRVAEGSVAPASVPAERTRYYWENDGFAPGDAVILAGMLRWLRPARVLEIGAGYSTAVMLDVREQDESAGRGWPMRLECVDPEPERLESLLREDDAGRLVVHRALVQEFPLAHFAGLEPNDILFVDSSHVLKLGSDVEFLFFEVLPRLRSGVVVHIHDVPWPFVYPVEWYEEGRAWNELQVLRAFLSFNTAWRILCFNDYLIKFEPDVVAAHAPLALRQPKALAEGNAAVGFWMVRESRDARQGRRAHSST